MVLRRVIRRVVLRGVVLLGFVCAGCAASRGDRGVAREFAARYARHAVAADHHLASEAGLEALRAGGNAVDAAVAASLALSVVRPFSCGIGGGGFMVIHLGDVGGGGARSVAINYRETAPGASTTDMFAREGQATGAASASRAGGLAVGVPGTVAGLLLAHERYGRLSREAVLAPAIRLAERGFEADAAYVRAARGVAKDFGEQAGWEERFGFVWERYLRRGQVRVGDVIHVPEQAAALRLIARDGVWAFYEGPIAEAIVRAVRRDGGIMTREDLRGFAAVEVEALQFEYAGRTVVTMPPPSSGGVTMAQALGVFERLRTVGFETEAGSGPGEGVYRVGAGTAVTRDVFRATRLVEAFKLAFADRAAWLGDPAFVDVPVGRLLSPEYLDARAALVDPSRTRPAAEYVDASARVELSEDGGTSHLSVVDRWGNAVACTETINLEFGSLLAVEEFGFILNNQMDDFTSRVGEANAFGLRQSARNLPAAGKRPLSSMTPTIVLDSAGRVEVVAGASGGPRIITGTTLAVLDALGGVGAGEAVEAARLHHQWMPDRLDLEPGLAGSATPFASPGGGRTFADAMRARGHVVREVERLCVVQLIRWDGRAWEAASDPRKGGRPAGD